MKFPSDRRKDILFQEIEENNIFRYSKVCRLNDRKLEEK